jgi:hypothetical protein
MGLACVAFGYGHFWYEPGAEKIKGEALQQLKDRITRLHNQRDRTSGVHARGILIAMLWKQAMPPTMIEALQQEFFQVEPLQAE